MTAPRRRCFFDRLYFDELSGKTGATTHSLRPRPDLHLTGIDLDAFTALGALVDGCKGSHVDQFVFGRSFELTPREQAVREVIEYLFHLVAPRYVSNSTVVSPVVSFRLLRLWNAGSIRIVPSLPMIRRWLPIWVFWLAVQVARRRPPQTPASRGERMNQDTSGRRLAPYVLIARAD